jgi:hypothetical protein
MTLTTESLLKFLEETLNELENNKSDYPFEVFHFLNNKSDFSFSEKRDVLESLYSNLDEKSRKKSCAVEFFTGTNQEKKQGLVELIKKTLEYYDGYYDESYYTTYVEVDPDYDERGMIIEIIKIMVKNATVKSVLLETHFSKHYIKTLK